MSALSSRASSDSSETKARWSGFEAIAVGVIGTFAVQLLIRTAIGPASSHGISVELLARVLAGLGSVGLCYLIVRSHGQKGRSLGLRWPEAGAWKRIAPAWAVYFGLSFLFSSIIFIILSVVIPGFELDQKQKLGISHPQSLVAFGISYLLVVILPAVFEEIVYRGFIFAGIRTQLKFWPAAVLTSLLFGAAHLQLNVAIDTFVLSIVLCWLYERYHSVFPVIAVHLLKNTIAFALLFVFSL